MKKSFKIALLILLILAAMALAALFISTQNVAVLNPKGIIGLKERHLIVTSSELMLIVVIPVFVFTWLFAWRYREGNGKAKHTPDWEHNYIAEYCWWGVPLVIIVILSIITWRASHELNPFKPIRNGKPPMRIQAVALQWKWLFIYPEQKIAVINFLQFPEDTPIDFEITADAPMNSFWIPQLGGQIYAMPAMRTKLHLIANEVGDFRGSSANISGKGFAGMNFIARSSTEEDFNRWVNTVKGSSKSLGMQEFNELVEPTEYVPVTLYTLADEDLFDQIIKKYTVPQQ